MFLVSCFSIFDLARVTHVALRPKTCATQYLRAHGVCIDVTRDRADRLLRHDVEGNNREFVSDGRILVPERDESHDQLVALG